MTDYDLEENKFVNLVIYYGERRDSLVNLFKGRFELRTQRFTILTYFILIIILLILVLLFWFIILKRRSRDDDY
jgi:hypothetical protein